MTAKLWGKYSFLTVAVVLFLFVCCAQPAHGAGIDMHKARIDGGLSHSIALNEKGLVMTWGSNQQGQLGPGARAEERTPRVVEGLDPMTAVAAGYSFSACLSSEGKVYTWGGDLQTEPTLVSGLSDVIAISAGQTDLLALTQSGQVYQWTLGERPQKVQGLRDIAAIDAGLTHYLALNINGEVYAWGENDKGQLGDGSTQARQSPTKLELSNIIDISAGYNHSLAAAFDGTVYAWGANDSLQLGNEKLTEDYVPLPMVVEDVKRAVAVEAGNMFSMALTALRTVYTWGHGEYGQLGLGNTVVSSGKPAAVTTRDVEEIAAGVYHNLLVTKYGQCCAWGRNQKGQLGIKDSGANETKPKQVGFEKTAGLTSYSIHNLNLASSWAVDELTGLYRRDLVPPLLWRSYQSNMTRAEFVYLLVYAYRALKPDAYVKRSSMEFTDTVGHAMEQEILLGYDMGFVKGTSAKQFSPDKALTRQEAAVMMYNFINKISSYMKPWRGELPFSDNDQIAEWASYPVGYLYDSKIISGMANGSFSPLTNLTREQGMLLVEHLAAVYDDR